MVTTTETTRETFTSQAAPELLAALRGIAKADGRDFDATLEEAICEYVESKSRGKVRPEVMAHFRDSLEKNRRLAELLAQ